MKKITKEALDAFIFGKEEFKKGSTEIRRRPDSNILEYYLWGNNIATHDLGSHKIRITTAGWNTVTTRDRLCSIPGVLVRKKKGILYLNGSEWDGSWVEVNIPPKTLYMNINNKQYERES